MVLGVNVCSCLCVVYGMVWLVASFGVWGLCLNLCWFLQLEYIFEMKVTVAYVTFTSRSEFKCLI